MAVKKKIDNTIKSFIDNGADVKASKDKDFKNVLIRIPTNVLNRLDERIEKKPWMNRTQFIVEAIDDKLESNY